MMILVLAHLNRKMFIILLPPLVPSIGRERRHHRRHEGGRDDFKVDAPEFEGQLNPSLFLESLNTSKSLIRRRLS